MSRQITHIRLAGGGGHEHIVRYQWRDGLQTGDNDKPSMVAWVANGGVAYVADGYSRVPVGVVSTQAVPPYLRTYADGDWTNNLLALPHF